jgi:hypothetical protein
MDAHIFDTLDIWQMSFKFGVEVPLLYGFSLNVYDGDGARSLQSCRSDKSQDHMSTCPTAFAIVDGMLGRESVD